MKPALAQVCSLPSPFERDLEDYAAGGCTALEVWLTKLEGYVESHSIEAVRGLIGDMRMAVPVASYQGGLLGRQGAAREESWTLFRRRLELCQALEIPLLVVACDVGAPLRQQDVECVRSSLAEAARLAAQYQRRIALEFQASAAFGNNLQTAVALVEEVGSPHLGLCLDVFHFCVGPSKLADLGYLTGENLFHVQLSDLADLPRELATDSDRILPGDGDLPLRMIVDRLRQIQYPGHVSVELMNPRLWQVSARQFGEVATTALGAVLEGG